MYTLTPFQRSPWSILDELESLQEDMNRAFSGWSPTRPAGRSSKVYPPVNIWSCKDGVTIDAEIPGIDVGAVNVSVESDQLTIRGKVNGHEQGEDKIFHRRERPSGEFMRTLQLPFRANGEEVKANYRNGILRITVPRTEADKPHKVAIEAA